MATILNYKANQNIYHELDLSIPENIDKIPEINSDSGYNNPDLLDRITKDDKNINKKTYNEISYDWKTKNKSFLILHNDLVRLGIKRNKFFLAIYDRDLIGIDPYSPILPIDLQVKITIECMRNPWYFLREIARIPVDGKPICIGGGSEFKIDRNSLASWYLFLLNIDHYASKPRQTGKTQNSLCQINYAFHYGTASANFTFANKDAGNNKMNLYRLKCQRDMLPSYLQMKISIDEDGRVIKESNNVTTMRNPINGNTITLLPRANSVESANSNGRGMTSSIGLFDEFDFQPYNVITLDSSSFAYGTARENAIANKCISARLFISTPGDLDTRDGAAATEYISHMLVWDDHMYDIPINKLIEAVNDKKSKRNGIVFVEHTWKQLRKTESWYEDQCQRVSYKQETIMREINLKRLHGSSLSPFDRDDIFYIQNHCKTPITQIDYSKNLCPIYIYEELNKKTPYILSIDPSEGLGGDNNAMSLINPYTLQTAAEYKSPYISQPDCATMIFKFMDEYCPKSLIVVENNKGRELINIILSSKYRYQLWYSPEKLLDVNSKVDKYNKAARTAYERRAWGLSTGKDNRPILFSILETLMTEDKSKIISQFLIDDIVSLIRKPNGRIEASSGKHDDNVMSYLIGLYVYYHAKNLEEFGIHRGMVDPNNSILTIHEKEQKTIDDMREIFSTLPKEVQEATKDIIFSKNEYERAEDYYKSIEHEKNKMNGYDNLFANDNTTIAMNDQFDTIQDNYDSELLDMNAFDINNNDDFDLNNFL